MAEGDTIEEGILEQLVQKLTPCIERGELDACVEEAARLADEVGIDALVLLDLAEQMDNADKHEFAYVLALGAVGGLDGFAKVVAYFNAGVAAQFLGNVGMAEEHYNKVIELDPNYADAYNNYATLLQKMNRIDEAEEYYKKAIDANSNLGAAYYNYAILFEEINRTDEAEAYYKKAIELDSTDAVACNNYANLLKRLGNKYAAETYYLKSIEVDPDYAGAHYNYANLLRERGKFYEAEKEVMRVFQIVQDDSSSQDILPYAHGTLGDILADEDYYEEAKKEYQKALDQSYSMVNSSISEIHNNLGWVYTQMKIYKKARGEFKKARVLDAMNVKAIRNYRALDVIGDEPIVSKIQICLGMVLLIPLCISYYFFYNGRLSEMLFVAQSIFLISLLIFVALHHQLAKVKIGNIEFEKSAEHRYLKSKSQSQEAISMVER